jgi:DNA-binding XRE family transcriptional regulator
MIMKFLPFDELKKELLKDPEARREYELLQPEFEIMKQIIEARIHKKITQKELARRMGTGQSAISRLESGEYNPSLKFLKKFAESLGTRLVIRFES